EEDPHDPAERRPIGWIDDAQEQQPAAGHQRAIDQNQRDGDRDETPVGAGERRQHLRRVAAPEDVGSQAGGDGRARSRFQGCGLGSVSRWRSGSCFTWYARTRNFAYGTNCFIAPTLTWHGLRQVGQIESFTCSRWARLSALKYNSSAGVVSTLPIASE